MILPDINILIYAINKDTVYHASARKWLQNVFSSTEIVGIAWIVILGFLRIITNGRVMPNPLDFKTACSIIGEWLALPNVRIVDPTEHHWKIFQELLEPLGTAGNLTSDAHLAAMAIEHRAILYSTDNDFSRFRTLRWKNPLEE